MDLHELRKYSGNDRITQSQLEAVTPLYIALDLDKQIFGNLVAAAGITQLADRAEYWKTLETNAELSALQLRHARMKSRIDELDTEADAVRQDLISVEGQMRKLREQLPK